MRRAWIRRLWRELDHWEPLAGAGALLLLGAVPAYFFPPLVLALVPAAYLYWLVAGRAQVQGFMETFSWLALVSVQQAVLVALVLWNHPLQWLGTGVALAVLWSWGALTCRNRTELTAMRRAVEAVTAAVTTVGLWLSLSEQQLGAVIQYLAAPVSLAVVWSQVARSYRERMLELAERHGRRPDRGDPGPRPLLRLDALLAEVKESPLPRWVAAVAGAALEVAMLALTAQGVMAVAASRATGQPLPAELPGLSPRMLALALAAYPVWKVPLIVWGHPLRRAFRTLEVLSVLPAMATALALLALRR